MLLAADAGTDRANARAAAPQSVVIVFIAIIPQTSVAPRRNRSCSRQLNPAIAPAHGDPDSHRGPLAPYGAVLVTVARVSRPRYQLVGSLVNVLVVVLAEPSGVDTVTLVALPKAS